MKRTEKSAHGGIDMGKSVKSFGKVSMIRGNDGPTSIFIVGKGKKTVKQIARNI